MCKLLANTCRSDRTSINGLQQKGIWGRTMTHIDTFTTRSKVSVWRDRILITGLKKDYVTYSVCFLRRS